MAKITKASDAPADLIGVSLPSTGVDVADLPITTTDPTLIAEARENKYLDVEEDIVEAEAHKVAEEPFTKRDEDPFSSSASAATLEAAKENRAKLAAANDAYTSEDFGEHLTTLEAYVTAQNNLGIEDPVVPKGVEDAAPEPVPAVPAEPAPEPTTTGSFS